MEKRVITTEFIAVDVPIESSLRPTALSEYIGQAKAKENIKVFIDAAKSQYETFFKKYPKWNYFQTR